MQQDSFIIGEKIQKGESSKPHCSTKLIFGLGTSNLCHRPGLPKDFDFELRLDCAEDLGNTPAFYDSFFVKSCGEQYKFHQKL